jgi:iron complex transport system substrate-binding protein
MLSIIFSIMQCRTIKILIIKKEFIRSFTGLILLALISACSNETSATDSNTIGPQRVAVIGPAIAEMLEALDLLDHVAGLGEFGPWPESIKDLPVVGGYDSPNVEQILSLDIDTVLNVQSQAATAAHNNLESLGIRVVELDTSTFEGVFNSIEILGKLFNRNTNAVQLVKQIRADITEIELLTRGLERRRVLFVVGRDPVYVAGPGSHIDHLIRLAGGENIAHDAIAPYQQMSLEVIFERNPQVIIDTSDNRPSAMRGRHTGPWGRWSFLDAVQNDQVYWIHPSRLVIPGIRLPEMAQLIGKLVHPEVFGEPDDDEYREFVF